MVTITITITITITHHQYFYAISYGASTVHKRPRAFGASAVDFVLLNGVSISRHGMSINT
ncbi:MAG: hypothetical protein PHE90_04725 [Bacteroidales bacterium]|nr:hypothetical protein [Bacteroidales bacterium]